MDISVGGQSPAPLKQQSDRHAALKEASVELEATFLAEMLKSAGLGKPSGTFGGGAGEDQFSSMLVAQQARQLAKAGGIGLSETLFTALLEQDHAK